MRFHAGRTMSTTRLQEMKSLCVPIFGQRARRAESTVETNATAERRLMSWDQVPPLLV